MTREQSMFRALFTVDESLLRSMTDTRQSRPCNTTNCKQSVKAAGAEILAADLSEQCCCVDELLQDAQEHKDGGRVRSGREAL